MSYSPSKWKESGCCILPIPKSPRDAWDSSVPTVLPIPKFPVGVHRTTLGVPSHSTAVPCIPKSPRDQGTSWDSPRGPLTHAQLVHRIPKSPRGAWDYPRGAWDYPRGAWDYPRGAWDYTLGVHGTTLGVPSHSSVPTVRPIPKSTSPS